MANIRVTHGKVQVLLSTDRSDDTPIRVTHGKVQVLLSTDRSDDTPIRVTHGKVQVLGPGEPTKKLVIYSELGTGDPHAQQLRAWLQTKGYDLVLRDDANLLTDTDLADFDAVGSTRLSDGLGDDVRSKAEAAGIPYFIHMSGHPQIAGSGLTYPSNEAKLTGTIDGRASSFNFNLEILDNTHVITEPFTVGQKFYLVTGFMYQYAVDDGESAVGEVLAQGDPALWGASGQYQLIAIPAGTSDLDAPSVATTQRGLVWGNAYSLGDGLTTNGDTLLLRSFQWMLGELVASPATPDLTATVDSQTQVSLESSAFVAGDEGPHVGSQWQVTLSADFGYATPVYDSGQTATSLTKKVVTGLAADEQYRSRVRHLEQQAEGDVWSEWSADEIFTTWAAPDTPTISVNSTAADRVEFGGSAFASDDLDRTHAASEWQLTLAADTGFATPLETQLVTFGDLVTFNFTGLDLWVNQYIGRVRYQDDNGGWSAWSAASSATGLVADGQFYTAFAERPIGTDISTDVPADWDEIADGDYSDWPIEYRPDATCEVVSHRSSVDGDANTGDPIFWQGFPQVDTQIVWTRLLFEEQGGAGYPCGSGVQSPSGLICRESLGLLQTADMENDLWEVIRDGAGEWIFVPDGGPDGEPTRRYVAPGGGSDEVCQTPWIGSGANVPHARLDWLTAGDRAAGQWAQLRANTLKTCKFGTEQETTFLAGWPGISFCGFAAGDKDDSYIGQTVRYCTLYINWMRTTIYKYVGGIYSLLHWHSAAQQFPVGRYSWNYFKVGWDTDYQWSSYSGASGGRAEWSKITGADDGWDHGRVGLWYDRCGQYDPGETTTDYLDLVICSGNTVTFKNLLDGWHVRILSDNHGDQGERVYGDGGADVEWDFSTQAWPANTLRLYNSSDELVDEWVVPDGIWGGDVYYINAGGLGVGPIGGAAVRLGP